MMSGMAELAKEELERILTYNWPYVLMGFVMIDVTIGRDATVFAMFLLWVSFIAASIINPLTRINKEME